MDEGFFFISGTKRSATHYLNRLFDGHPELGNTLIESYLFEYYLGPGQELEAQILAWLKQAPMEQVYQHLGLRQLLPAFQAVNVYDHAFPEQSRFSMDLDQEHFCRLLAERRSSLESLAQLALAWTEILGTFEPWSQQTNRKTWVFKCADFGPTLLGADKMGLLAKAVFLVRNPLGIVNSIKKRRQSEPHRQFHVFETLSICQALERSVQIVEQLGERCLVVRYEDLIKPDSEVLGQICDFWGVARHACLKQATLLGRPWAINTSFSGPDGRKDILLDWEKDLVARHTTIFQERFGYRL